MNFGQGKVSEKSGNGTLIDIFGNEKCKVNFGFKDNVIHNMAWWLKSAGASNFALSQEQCPISL